MQRRFSLELNLNNPKSSSKPQQPLSQHQVGNQQTNEAEFCSGRMINEEDQSSLHSIKNYTVEHLAEDLVKSAFIQERIQEPKRESALKHEDSILEQMGQDVKKKKKKTVKWNSKNSLQTTYSNSQYGQEILNYESFRNSLAKIILEKVEE